ncbi:GDSL esterase/lipase At5g03610 [Prunus persica]|uniref:GDSL esterase/lipase At5g03610 n=1 Tax=Prunus persica TaxID=3760 RepID=UPI0009AB87BB|nr:GDSL esterase/lipase At5g03610 [Prunus persica]
MEKQTAIASSCLFLLYIATFTAAEVLEAHHHHHRHNHHGSVKFFVFEESYVDTENIEKSVSTSWKEPYDINFSRKPAGRFSDSLVFTEYITSFLGIRSPVPYTLRKFVKKSKLESGMNFAYGGIGVFDRVFGGPKSTTQIDFFQLLLEQKLYSTKNDVVNSSIALVSVADNDYAAYFGNHTEDFAVVTKSIIKQLAVDLERIHGLRVRKIAVTAIGPLGCLPRMTSFLSYQNCSEVANLVSIFHNQILRQKVEELNKETKKSSFVILDLYNASLSAIMLPKHYQASFEPETAMQFMVP